jgi:hypothetical protein
MNSGENRKNSERTLLQYHSSIMKLTIGIEPKPLWWETQLNSRVLVRRERNVENNDQYNKKLTKFWTKVKVKVVPVLNLIKHYAMKAYGGVDV